MLFLKLTWLQSEDSSSTNAEGNWFRQREPTTLLDQFPKNWYHCVHLQDNTVVAVELMVTEIWLKTRVAFSVFGRNVIDGRVFQSCNISYWELQGHLSFRDRYGVWVTCLPGPCIPFHYTGPPAHHIQQGASHSLSTENRYYEQGGSQRDSTDCPSFGNLMCLLFKYTLCVCLSFLLKPR